MKVQNSRLRAFLFIIFCLPLAVIAQTATNVERPTSVDGWVERLSRFGKAIPQEKVYVHLDNTCYFLGDTIWYAAYTRRTDKDLPSGISRVLYAELYNQDGYLVERQLVEMKGGRGNGCFALPDTLYGGFYELRAYTRWQLNWGITEKEHTSYAEEWFYNKDMAKEFYRDYDKLYSRVFPVYDKPQEPGDFFREMTTRPMRRYFKSGAKEPQLVLSLFPEGGQLVAGLPCRVAFEAATESGEACEGQTLPPPSLSGREQIPAEGVPTVSRGRGVFTFTPEAGKDYTFTFTATDGRTAKAKLSAAETDGVALQVLHKGDAWDIQVHAAGEAATKQLGVTVMHEGVVIENGKWTVENGQQEMNIPDSELKPGVHQVTVFDSDGRVWADRLFFVTSPTLTQPSLAISGLKDQYAPFESVTLDIKHSTSNLSPNDRQKADTAPALPSLTGKATGRRAELGNGGGGGSAGSSFSLSIRDAATQDYLYDCGNILTEMLLASEIKGFVPDPGYFFEADDEEHRVALDLLMMTQGWRRFDWHTMATPGAFELTQPAETQTPIMRGEVLRYSSSIQQDDVRAYSNTIPTPYSLEEEIARMHPTPEDSWPEKSFRARMMEPTDTSLSPYDEFTGLGQGEIITSIISQTYAHESRYPAGSYRLRSDIATSRFNAKELALANEVRVHAEFTQPGSESIVGDTPTRNGKFSIQAPHFEGECVFFLAASDTTKWKAGKPHTWIDVEDEKSKDAEFYVRILWPYPRFTLPYNYYHMAARIDTTHTIEGNSQFDASKFETQMGGITVRARHGGLRRLDLSKPAYKVDAYVAYNDATDAGLMCGEYRGRIHFLNSVARLYVGDMQTNNAYLLEPRYDGSNISRLRSGTLMDRYNYLMNLDSVRLYTDYTPRTGGDPRATEENVGRLSVDLQQLPSEGQRVTYRDRRYILQGFNVAEDFYHPNYSTPPAEGAKDYRRTLYWNPDVKLDANGQAHIQFFTGSKTTTLAVDAQGQAADGTLLTN